ncbi:type I secretion system permease/ATPase [Marinobacter sp.]|uniref:type I secretion system permease/ATPase n=1 Tax=Marinobacter sp. TaxID=50741 RepID=UPI003BA894E9
MHNSQDCLRKAISLLCQHLGKQVSLKRLDRLDDENLALEQRVETMMMAEGFEVTTRRMAIEQLASCRLPLLVRLVDGSWHLLVEVRDSHFALMRTDEGGDNLKEVDRKTFRSEFDGTTIIATPAFRTTEWVGSFAQKEQISWFWSPLAGFWRVFADVGVASLVANALAIAIALFAMQVYDRVIPTTAHDTLWVLATGVLLAIAMEMVIRLIRLSLLEGVGRTLDRTLGRKLFDQSIHLRLESRPATPGVLATQIREFESVREFFTSASAALVSDLPFVVLFLVVISFLGGAIVWVPVVALVLLLGPALLCQPLLSRLSKEGLQESALKNSLLLESFEGLESVKAASGEKRLSGIWGDLHDRLSHTTYRLRRISQILVQWTGTVQQLTYVGVVVVGAYLIAAGDLTVGALVACTILVSRTVAPLGQASAMLSRWQHVKAALQGLDSLMNAPTERPQGRQFVERPVMAGAYRCEGVRWRQSEDGTEIVIIDALTIDSGQRLALLGASGAGKSSLLRLLAGLVSPTQGQILVDDTNLDHIDPLDRSANIGYLPQDVTLFNGTLRDNLNPGLQPHTDAQLTSLVEDLGLGSFLKKLPLGLDTLIQGNRSVSGGQRQLIGLARVVVQNPAIVLMDEPTSSLDQQTEQCVLKFLKPWLEKRTLVVATHKRSLLELADRVVVIQGGSVVMDGPRDSLTVKVASEASK